MTIAQKYVVMNAPEAKALFLFYQNLAALVLWVPSNLGMLSRFNIQVSDVLLMCCLCVSNVLPRQALPLQHTGVSTPKPQRQTLQPKPYNLNFNPKVQRINLTAHQA